MRLRRHSAAASRSPSRSSKNAKNEVTPSKKALKANKEHPSDEDYHLDVLFNEDEFVSKLPYYKRVSKRLIISALFLGCLLGIFVIQPYFLPALQQGPGELFVFLREEAARWPKHLTFLSQIDLSLFQSMGDLNVLERTKLFISQILRSLELDQADVLLGFPGKVAHKRGWRAHFPVVLIPGMTSTGLEVWQSNGCAASFFRDRIWGSLSMFQLLLLKKQCWLEHVLLDPCHGGDPPSIKLRAAQGLEAADYLIPGYWVWGKIIEALSQIGYDSTMLSLAAYDWRLSFDQLEERDQYFSRLAILLESNLQLHGKKSVVVSHSLGSLAIVYFLNWVTERKGQAWVDTHVDTFVSIGGPFLGLPKAVASVLSGEMKDTAQLGSFETYLLESFLSKKERANLFQSWSCLSHLLPVGGKAVWHTDQASSATAVDDSPDDPIKLDAVYSDPSLKQPQSDSILDGSFIYARRLGLSVDGENLLDFLQRFPYFPDFYRARVARMQERNSTGPSNITAFQSKSTEPQNSASEKNAHFHILRTPLPKAPNMKIYLAYGVGQPTERSYFYCNCSAPFSLLQVPKDLSLFESYCKARDAHVQQQNLSSDDLNEENCGVEGGSTFQNEPTYSFEFLNNFPWNEASPGQKPSDEGVNFSLDVHYDAPELDIRRGVLFTDGDGTVPILSAGFMGVKAWKNTQARTTAEHTKKYVNQTFITDLNPSGIKVFVREYDHDPLNAVSSKGINVRGGPKTSDHVDILGNHQLTMDILQIVSNNNKVDVQGSFESSSLRDTHGKDEEIVSAPTFLDDLVLSKILNIVDKIDKF